MLHTSELMDDFLEMEYEDRLVAAEDLDSETENFCNWCGNLTDDCECAND